MDKNTLAIEGDLKGLVDGVHYIQEFYSDKVGFTQDRILQALIKVMEIERLRGFNDKRGVYHDFSNVDSFVREQVFELITRELDN